ncbi:hypothetical protein ABEB36_001510 [Hypothenemus hampei]|uniref:Uncharacterized protein n=1 Tax=Hypothenemus hampei TaxID=57062 RepID=A0ABD1FFF4_HYPHA
MAVKRNYVRKGVCTEVTKNFCKTVKRNVYHSYGCFVWVKPTIRRERPRPRNKKEEKDVQREGKGDEEEEEEEEEDEEEDEEEEEYRGLSDSDRRRTQSEYRRIAIINAKQEFVDGKE